MGGSTSWILLGFLRFGLQTLQPGLVFAPGPRPPFALPCTLPLEGQRQLPKASRRATVNGKLNTHIHTETDTHTHTPKQFSKRPWYNLSLSLSLYVSLSLSLSLSLCLSLSLPFLCVSTSFSPSPCSCCSSCYPMLLLLYTIRPPHRPPSPSASCYYYDCYCFFWLLFANDCDYYSSSFVSSSSCACHSSSFASSPSYCLCYIFFAHLVILLLPVLLLSSARSGGKWPSHGPWATPRRTGHPVVC